MMRYTVRASRSGRWWALTVPDLPGVFSQARRLDESAEMASEAIALWLDVDASSVEVDVVPQLDQHLAKQVKRSRALLRQAEQLRDEAATASRDAARALIAAGLSQRDAAKVLGISFQRVSQL